MVPRLPPLMGLKVKELPPVSMLPPKVLLCRLLKLPWARDPAAPVPSPPSPVSSRRGTVGRDMVEWEDRVRVWAVWMSRRVRVGPGDMDNWRGPGEGEPRARKC